MDNYWILDARGHRVAELEHVVVSIAELELDAPGSAALVTVVDGEDDWVCDRCFGNIPLRQPNNAGGPDPTKLPPHGSLRPVPVVNAQVLCPDCFYRVLPDVAVSNRWPGCGCGPCGAANEP